MIAMQGRGGLRARVRSTYAAHRRGLLLMLGVTLLWPAIVRAELALFDTHHPWQVLTLRYLGHLAVLVPAALLLRRRQLLRTPHPVLQLVRGALMFGMAAWLIVGANFAASSWIWALFWTMPAMTAIGATLLLGERHCNATTLACALGAVGAASILGGHMSVTGTLFGLGMAASVSGYMLLTRMLRDESIEASLFYSGVGALLPVALLSWRVWTPVVLEDFAIIGVLGLLSVGILGALDLSLANAPAGLVVPVLALVPVWDAALLVPVRRALPPTGEIAGAVAVTLGLIILFAGRSAAAVVAPAVPQPPVEG